MKRPEQPILTETQGTTILQIPSREDRIYLPWGNFLSIYVWDLYASKVINATVTLTPKTELPAGYRLFSSNQWGNGVLTDFPMGETRLQQPPGSIGHNGQAVVEPYSGQYLYWRELLALQFAEQAPKDVPSIQLSINVTVQFEGDATETLFYGDPELDIDVGGGGGVVD